jgi:antitoxin (DNA-binding transcriptional repressor) of toxin-antitoxin stability system
MEVKTGALRNHLCRYLRQVRETGETIVVLDRNKPVAEIRPFRAAENVRSGIWELRRRLEQEEKGWEEDFELPERITRSRKHKNPLD